MTATETLRKIINITNCKYIDMTHQIQIANKKLTPQGQLFESFSFSIDYSGLKKDSEIIEHMGPLISLGIPKATATAYQLRAYWKDLKFWPRSVELTELSEVEVLEYDLHRDKIEIIFQKKTLGTSVFTAMIPLDHYFSAMLCYSSDVADVTDDGVEVYTNEQVPEGDEPRKEVQPFSQAIHNFMEPEDLLNIIKHFIVLQIVSAKDIHFYITKNEEV